MTQSSSDRPPWLFKKGVSGNPGGRPKFSLAKELRERLEQHPEERESLINALLELAKKPDLPALKEILERIDGKVADKTEFSGQLLVATPEQLEMANRYLALVRGEEEKLLMEYTNKDNEPYAIDHEGEVVKEGFSPRVQPEGIESPKG